MKNCSHTTECGVPHGSVLGPILFLLYDAVIQLLIEDCGLHPQHLADNTQIYGFCSPMPSSCMELQSRISDCIDFASSWMRSHMLQLNIAKTEIIWLTTGRRSHLLPQQPLQDGSDLITPVLVVRDLGIHIDADVSMRSHVMKTMSACFAVLRRLRGIHRSVPRTVFQSLVSCLVLPQLDYCNFATQCRPAFHYTLHAACNWWWTRSHGLSLHYQSATTSCRSYTGWKFHGG